MTADEREQPAEPGAALPPASPPSPSAEQDVTSPPIEAPIAAPPAATPAAPVETELRTFLIADIRGYTSYTEEHGDEAATALASRFAALVRDVVESRAGFLLELRGDEALAVFTSSRSALKAANEIQRRQEIDALPRGIGIGLDAGEAIPFEGGFRGSALNLAARLCAQAGPGQIVASEAVIHLAAKVDGLAYVEARTLRLKGLDEPVRAVTVVPEGRAPKRRRSAGGGRRVDRRSLLAVGGVALVAVLIGVIAWAGPLGGLGGGSSANPSPSPGGASASSTPTPSKAPGAAAIDPEDLPLLAFLDPTTADVRQRLDQPDDAVEAIFAEGSFWVLGRRPQAIYQLDPDTGAVGSSIPIGFDVSTFAVADSRVYVAELEDFVRVFDAPSGRELARHRVGGFSESGPGQVSLSEPIWDIAYGDGSLWVALGWDGAVDRVDPASGEILTTVPTAAEGRYNRNDGVAFADDGLWVSDSLFGLVSRIDAATDRVEMRTTLQPGIGPIAAGGGFGWVLSPLDGNVIRVDERGGTSRFPVEPGTDALAYDDEAGTIWTTSQDGGTVTRIDAVSGTPTTAYLGHAAGPIAASGGHVLAGVAPSADEVVAALEGTVLRIATDDTFIHTDPAYEWRSEARRQLDQLTCARLLDHPLEASGSSIALAPAVAAEMPEVSEDGRTYTFRIRDGFRFSPPSDQPLTADAYRLSIERALSPVLEIGASGFQYLPDIEGVYDYRDGRTEHISGITAEGDRLTIRLVAPSPTFLERLWLPWFCPVPVGTPVAATGQSDPPIPAAGSYYIAHHVPGEVLVLLRNPGYPEPRPGTFDAVAWFTQPNLRRAIGRVEEGALDYVDGSTPELLVDSRTDERWGPGSEAAAGGDQRLFHRPDHAVDFLAVNPGSEAMADPDVRRAVALALDRRALGRWWGVASDDMLPMTMPGMVDGDRYALDTAQTEEARALLAGREVELRIAFPGPSGCPECPEVGRTLIDQLEAAGFAVRLDEADYPALWAEGTDSGIDLAWTIFWIGYPDPAAWLVGALTETDDPRVNRFSASYPGGWLPDDIAAERDRVAALESPERIEAAGALADRLADELIVIPILNGAYSQFVAERIGCVDGQPYQAEFHLLAMCLD